MPCLAFRLRFLALQRLGTPSASGIAFQITRLPTPRTCHEQVYKAIRHGTSEVAVKHMDCLVEDPQKLHQMRREIAIMKKVSFDANIVQFYGACTVDNGAWLMMEYMEAREPHGLWVLTLTLT